MVLYFYYLRFGQSSWSNFFMLTNAWFSWKKHILNETEVSLKLCILLLFFRGEHSTGKARGTPGSWHHSQSPPDVSVHSRETCFPCTAWAAVPPKSRGQPPLGRAELSQLLQFSLDYSRMPTGSRASIVSRLTRLPGEGSWEDERCPSLPGLLPQGVGGAKLSGRVPLLSLPDSPGSWFENQTAQ